LRIGDCEIADWGLRIADWVMGKIRLLPESIRIPKSAIRNVYSSPASGP